ncbi:very short patch repair endonuclease [Mesorhizobium sp.]|uniref:very short patch repair endonuclease n=1 Tax=Mesorhizobium sp. TaxID=1871066 RepID=UPI0025EA52BC|nr:very short patch repair endonuclease [Mesorhizobium sp.]
MAEVFFQPTGTVVQTMVDSISSEVRSRIMGLVRGRNTRPEIYVRRILHAAGYRFRVHRKDLPGRPDIVLPKYWTAVFINGCFWHGHDCRRGKRPSSNMEFWAEKIDRTMGRDRRNSEALTAAGWRVVTIWECRLEADTDALLADLADVSGRATVLSS